MVSSLDDFNHYHSNLLYINPNHTMDGENFRRKLYVVSVVLPYPPFLSTLGTYHQAKPMTNIYPSIKNVKCSKDQLLVWHEWGVGLSKILMLFGTSLLDTLIFFFLPLPCKSTGGYRGQNTHQGEENASYIQI